MISISVRHNNVLMTALLCVFASATIVWGFSVLHFIRVVPKSTAVGGQRDRNVVSTNMLSLAARSADFLLDDGYFSRTSFFVAVKLPACKR